MPKISKCGLCGNWPLQVAIATGCCKSVACKTCVEDRIGLKSKGELCWNKACKKPLTESNFIVLPAKSSGKVKPEVKGGRRINVEDGDHDDFVVETCEVDDDDDDEEEDEDVLGDFRASHCLPPSTSGRGPPITSTPIVAGGICSLRVSRRLTFGNLPPNLESDNLESIPKAKKYEMQLQRLKEDSKIHEKKDRLIQEMLKKMKKGKKRKKKSKAKDKKKKKEIAERHNIEDEDEVDEHDGEDTGEEDQVPQLVNIKRPEYRYVLRVAEEQKLDPVLSYSALKVKVCVVNEGDPVENQVRIHSHTGNNLEIIACLRTLDAKNETYVAVKHRPGRVVKVDEEIGGAKSLEAGDRSRCFYNNSKPIIDLQLKQSRKIWVWRGSGNETVDLKIQNKDKGEFHPYDLLEVKYYDPDKISMVTPVACLGPDGVSLRVVLKGESSLATNIQKLPKPLFRAELM